MSAVVNGPFVMLVVEDNPADVMLLKEALDATKTAATVHVVENGGKAMEFLRCSESGDDVPRPDIIVLDLNLPIKNGHEVLMELASEPGLNTIPVAVFTTSTSDGCVCDMYTKGKCLYFTKTGDFHRLQDIVRKIAAHARDGNGHE